MTVEEKDIAKAVDCERKQKERTRTNDEEYESVLEKERKKKRVSRFLIFERWLKNCELVEKRKKEERNNENEEEKERRRQETKERIMFLREGRSEEQIKKILI